MKKSWLTTVLIALCILLPTLLVITLSPTAEAALDPKPSDVKVDHIVQIRNGGLLIINDTVTLLAKQEETIELSKYTLGFPYGYQFNLDYAFAYEPSNPDSRLNLELDVNMGQPGFYGVNVVFPQVVTITENVPYTFTVVYVFSNSIEPIASTYNASFPAYPSLSQTASTVNVTIIFPTGLNFTDSSYKNEDVNFKNATIGSNQYFNYVKSNLTEFSQQQGWLVISQAANTLEVLDVKEFKRDIALLDSERMTVTESYRITSKAGQLSKITIKLPIEALDVLVYDEFGLISNQNLVFDPGVTSTNVTITFTAPYTENEDALFSVYYQLPWKNYVSSEGWSDFRVSLPFTENFDWTVRKMTIAITLSEGAALTTSTLPTSLNSVQNNAFSKSLTFTYQNATPFQNLQPINFTYSRTVFWESFRPTLWMGTLILFIGAVVGAWRFTKSTVTTVPSAMISVRVDDFRKFVDLYDEKRRLQQELESLEVQARKGKIPRRNYKVRKMTIESRLTSLSRDSKTLEEKIRTAGPRFNDLMRQIEVSEAELEGVEADINRAEVRYRRGEITPQAYNRLLEDVYRRRDRATTRIDGVLLRLKEEMI